jgi:hypothetical protein
MGRPLREESPTVASLLVGLRVACDEKELRQRIKESCGEWNASSGLWMLPLGIARRLGLMGWIVGGGDGVADMFSCGQVRWRMWGWVGTVGRST